MSSGDDNSNHGIPGRSAYWLSWMLGAAILVAVVIAALHVAEGRELIDVAGRAKPWWLALAVCLQGATYLAQGEIFRRVPRAAGYHLPLTAAYELSLTKLFIDQALPSAGIGSTIVVALERRAVPRAVVAAGMVINIASYHEAYVVWDELARYLIEPEISSAPVVDSQGTSTPASIVDPGVTSAGTARTSALNRDHGGGIRRG